MTRISKIISVTELTITTELKMPFMQTYSQSFLPFSFDTFQHFQLFPAFLRFDPSLTGRSPVLRDERHVVHCFCFWCCFCYSLWCSTESRRDFRNLMCCDERGQLKRPRAHQSNQPTDEKCKLTHLNDYFLLL